MIKLIKGKINILIDGQFGSTGKGLFAEYLSDLDIQIAITNAGPNSGHTFSFKGAKQVTKQLPVTGILNTDSIIYITHGSIIEPSTFFKELELFNIAAERVIIDPRATVVHDKDIFAEEASNSSFTNISSTQSGAGNALSRKIRREGNIAGNYNAFSVFTKPFNLEHNLNSGKLALMEVPQGLGLSLNSKFYPYCTSRDITIANSLNDCGVHPYYLGKVLVCLRTFPIRVGNLISTCSENSYKDTGITCATINYSGDFYRDSMETTWDAIGVPKEYTTNTKRVRRVATFSYEQYKDMLVKLRPDYVFLNFCNYLSEEALSRLLDNLTLVTHLGFGDDIDKIIARE